MKNETNIWKIAAITFITLLAIVVGTRGIHAQEKQCMVAEVAQAKLYAANNVTSLPHKTITREEAAEIQVAIERVAGIKTQWDQFQWATITFYRFDRQGVVRGLAFNEAGCYASYVDIPLPLFTAALTLIENGDI